MKGNPVSSGNLSKSTLLIWGTIAGLWALWCYQPLGLFFLNDDFIHVPQSAQAIFGQRNSIRFVGDFSLYADSLLWGAHAAGFHFTNLLLHVAATILVYFTAIPLFRLLQISPAKETALLSAIIFAIYPFHSESVLWVIGRSGSLSTIAWLVAFLIHLKGGRRWSWAGYLVYAMALFTYESVLIYPLVATSVLLWSRRHAPLEFNHWKTISIILYVQVGLYFLIRVLWFGNLSDTYETGSLQSGEWGTLVKNYALLGARLVVPPIHQQGGFALACTGVAVLWGLLFWVNRARLSVFRPQYMMLALATAISILPYISLGIDTHGPESERYLYLPSFWICLLGSSVLSRLSVRMRQATLGVVILLSGIFLLQSAKAFRVSSAFAQTTLHIVQQHCGGGTVHFYGMPGEHNGAVIFRLGLPEAVAWLGGRCKHSQVVNHSPNTDPLLHLSGPPGALEAKSPEELFLKTGIKPFPTVTGDLIIACHQGNIWFTKSTQRNNNQ